MARLSRQYLHQKIHHHPAGSAKSWIAHACIYVLINEGFSLKRISDAAVGGEVKCWNFLSNELHNWEGSKHHLRNDIWSVSPSSEQNLTGHFRVHFSLHFKARLSAKTLLWKSVFIHIEIGTNHHKISHLASLWKRDWGELGNGLLVWLEFFSDIPEFHHLDKLLVP